MANRIVFIALLLELSVLWGCGGASSESTRQEVSDSSGIQIVSASGQDRPLPWRLQEKWRVGGAEDGPTAFSEISAGSVAASPDGGLVVLDRLSHRVVVLTANGEVTQVLGQEGQGPGEVAFPTSVAILPDRSLWVYDIGKRGVVRFSSAGEILPELRLEGQSYSSVLRPAANGVVMLQRELSTDSLRQYLLIADAERAGDTLRVPALEPPRQTEVPGCRVSIPIQRVFAPRILWDSWGARVVVAGGPEYDVGVYELGQLSMRLRRSIRPVAASEATAIAHYPEGFTLGLPGGSCTAEAAPMVRAQGYAPVVPILSNVRLAPSGEIWMLRSDEGHDPAPIDVWSAAGRYEGTLPVGTPFPAAILTDGSIVTVELDEYDVPVVAAWTILR